MRIKLYKLFVGILGASCLLGASLHPLQVQASDADNLRQKIITRSTAYNGSLAQYHYYDTNGNEHALATNQETELSLFQENSVSLPSAYDMREEGCVTSIKNQGYSGACWAFATVKSAESNAIRKKLTSSANADFSENHLAWFAFHPSKRAGDLLATDGFTPKVTRADAAYSWGGSPLLAVFNLAKWSGFVHESVAPFRATTQKQQQAMANTMQQKGETLRYNSSYHLQNATCYDDASTTVWKQALMQTSALTLGMYYNTSYLSASSNGRNYYQSSYTGKSAISAANHCVTIVGWDDNYSRLHFPASHRPSSDGAWLIANSYGTSANDDGYFWLSYEEPSICDVYSFEVEKAGNYSNNYQYDGYGWGSAITGTTDMVGANVFQCRRDYNQKLQAVGIYTITDNQSYTIRIYRNPKSGNPQSGTLLSSGTTTGTIAYNGFHTIPLTKPVTLSAGEKFSVVVTYHAKLGNEIYYPIEGTGQTSSNTVSSYASQTGQSYYYLNGSWVDTGKAGQNNLCLKAYATNTAAVPYLQLSNTKITIGTKEKVTLTYTAKHLSGKKLTWKSSNTKIATVSSKGVVVGKKKGTATITISCGTTKTTMKIKVKKAPKKIRFTKKVKKIKKGKSYTVKTKLSSGSASYHLTFRSSKPSVASVSADGKVTARKKGTAIIKVSTYNKKSAKIKIKVH
ncbi:MAG: lectin like domain-containing protein [Lachnospiraceae bacterium]|nr:lectin like domain-containing protein [Lachnospiraceae bacterium]